MPGANEVNQISVFSGDLRTFTFVKEPTIRSDLETKFQGYYGKCGDQVFYLPLTLLSENARSLLLAASEDGTLDGFEGSRIRYAGGRSAHPSPNRTYPQEFGFDPSSWGRNSTPSTPSERVSTQPRASDGILISPELTSDGAPTLVSSQQLTTTATESGDQASGPNSQNSEVSGLSTNPALAFNQDLRRMQPSRPTESQPNRYNELLREADRVRNNLSYSNRRSNIVPQPGRPSVPIGTRSGTGLMTNPQGPTVLQPTSLNLLAQTDNSRLSNPNYSHGQPALTASPGAHNSVRQNTNNVNPLPPLPGDNGNTQRFRSFAGSNPLSQVPPPRGTPNTFGQLAPNNNRQMPATNATARHSQSQIGRLNHNRQSASLLQSETGPLRYSVPQPTQGRSGFSSTIPTYPAAATGPQMPNNTNPWDYPMGSQNRPGYEQRTGNYFQPAPNPNAQQHAFGPQFGDFPHQIQHNGQRPRPRGLSPQDASKRAMIPKHKYDLAPIKSETYQQLREEQARNRSRPDISIISKMNPETARTFQSVGWDVMNAANDGTYTKALNTRQYENDITAPSQPDDYTRVGRNGKMQRARLPLETWLDPEKVYSSCESPRLPQYANLKVSESKPRFYVMSPMATRSAYVALERLVLSQTCMDRIFPFLQTYVNGQTPQGHTPKSRDYLNSLLERWRSMTHTCMELLALSLKHSSNADIDNGTEKSLFETAQAIIAGWPTNDDHAKSVLQQAVANTDRQKAHTDSPNALTYTKAVDKCAGAYKNHTGKLRRCNITQYKGLYPKPTGNNRPSQKRKSTAAYPAVQKKKKLNPSEDESTSSTTIPRRDGKNKKKNKKKKKKAGNGRG